MQMKKFCGIVSSLLIAGSAYAGGNVFEITVTNNLSDELLAPIVVTSASNDAHFFEGNYVTKAAEHQILTGDPAMVIESIGEGDAAVGHGSDGPPGVLLAPGKTVSFTFESDATTLRILAMVAPTAVPDNYVSAVADVHVPGSVTVQLSRFDIGHDEGMMKNSMVMAGDESGTVTITRK